MPYYDDRGEFPVDAAGRAILPGAIVMDEGGKVYSAMGWAYATGLMARGVELHLRYGHWAEVGEVIFRPESALVWQWPEQDIPRDRHARRMAYREAYQQSPAWQRTGESVRANRERAARALGRDRMQGEEVGDAD